MQIVSLAEQPQHLAKLAYWHHSEWSYLYPDISLRDRAESMADYFTAESVPKMFIAIDGDELLGSTAIDKNDMDTLPHLTPWISDVYVNPAYRGHGIGTALVRHAMEYARKNGVQTLYLYTPGQESFYTRLGWKRLTKDVYHNHPVSVMHVQLAPAAVAISS
ncbi:MAG: GNAT family N-acetyltransferase [Oceanospirillaceae bacterium]|nr:GNAT family N-acetyltransferase [Oceanospirillaceae bacterium]|tara:strand:+ start:2467 stop:2952 length:486 start_codon:yes stop_codon:yes gene_type:complete